MSGETGNLTPGQHLISLFKGQQVRACFENEEIDLVIRLFGSDYVTIRHDHIKPCFELLIYRNSATLDTLEAAYCPLNIEKKGTWLVKLAIEISRCLNLKNIKLLDRAYVRNGTFKEKLIVLRAFEGRYTSWYEIFGFKVSEDVAVTMQNIHDFVINDTTVGFLMTALRSDHEKYEKQYKELNNNPQFQILMTRLRKLMEENIKLCLSHDQSL